MPKSSGIAARDDRAEACCPSTEPMILRIDIYPEQEVLATAAIKNSGLLRITLTKSTCSNKHHKRDQSEHHKQQMRDQEYDKHKSIKYA
ncbi:hypothetical protein FHW73_002621 [Luteimonas sp. RC10]|nr:hypothetical protein [Luteimonas sp. RC10]